MPDITFDQAMNFLDIVDLFLAGCSFTWGIVHLTSGRNILAAINFTAMGFCLCVSLL